MSEKPSFVFYRGFADAIGKLDEKQRLTMYEAIIGYGLDKTEPSLDGVLSILWDLIKPQMDANWRRFDNGCKGGAPEGNQNARKQPRNNQKQPMVDLKTTKNNQKQPKNNQKQPKNNQKQPKNNQKQPNDNDNDIISSTSNNIVSSLTSCNNISSSSSSSSSCARTDTHTHVGEGAQADAQTLTPVSQTAIAKTEPHPLPPPQVFGTVNSDNVEQALEQILSPTGGYYELLCMKTGLTTEQIRPYLREFVLQVKSTNETWTNVGRLNLHLASWLDKKKFYLKQELKQQNVNENLNRQQIIAEKRASADDALAAAVARLYASN